MTTKTAQPPRICPQCGQRFTPTTHAATFCTPAHQRKFHDINAARGKVAVAIMQTWRRGKRGRTDLSAYALAQMALLSDRWNAEDARVGRRPELVVASKKAMGWTSADLD